MIVVDSSVVVAALVDSGRLGTWSAERLRAGGLIAPHLLPSEVANVLRRAERAGDISPRTASDAYRDMTLLAIELFAFQPFESRIWELRHNLSAYDAWYVALAESTELPLVTLDEALVHAPGTRCAFEVPAT